MRHILNMSEDDSYHTFRLEPNWDFEDKEPKIKIEITLDEIDMKNIDNLQQNKEKISKIAADYSKQLNFLVEYLASQYLDNPLLFF